MTSTEVFSELRKWFTAAPKLLMASFGTNTTNTCLHHPLSTCRISWSPCQVCTAEKCMLSKRVISKLIYHHHRNGQTRMVNENFKHEYSSTASPRDTTPSAKWNNLVLDRVQCYIPRASVGIHTVQLDFLCFSSNSTSSSNWPISGQRAPTLWWWRKGKESIAARWMTDENRLFAAERIEGEVVQILLVMDRKPVRFTEAKWHITVCLSKSNEVQP